MAEALLSAKQVAEELGLKTWTINEWRRQGKIPCRDIAHNVKKYKLSEVNAAIDRFKVREAGAR